MEDPDAPLPNPFVHAIVSLVPPMAGVPEGAIPNAVNIRGRDTEIPLCVGKNTFGRTVWGRFPSPEADRTITISRSLRSIPD